MGKLVWGCVFAAMLGAALVLRHVAIGDWGWAALHAGEFDNEACELYHVMRGLEQDPDADPAHAALVERCRPRSQENVWLLSQTGDALRFDRPSLVRLRIDGVDMAVDHHVENPVIVVEFPYPPVPVAAGAHWRAAGEGQRQLRPDELERLARYWNPSWAGLFAEWSLGRGKHEVWLGRAAIRDARHCASVEQHAARGARMCVLHVTNHKGEPVSVRFPLDDAVEWRLEMLEICRFGGRVRRWHNALLQSWFGRVEYADLGCTPYVDSAKAPSTASP